MNHAPPSETSLASFLKRELSDRNLSYRELAKKLRKIGQEETSSSVLNKLARGTFSAKFFIAVLYVLGVKSLALADIQRLENPRYDKRKKVVTQKRKVPPKPMSKKPSWKPLEPDQSWTRQVTPRKILGF